MDRLRQALPALLVLGVALAGCYHAFTTTSSSTSSSSPSSPAAVPDVGGAAPEITGTDQDGKEFKLSDYRGKVVLLDFWGNW